MAMLSLWLVTSGGMDWKELLDSTYLMGNPYPILLTLFIALIHIAIMNIITGIFVEQAMKQAQPHRDMLALEHHRNEKKLEAELTKIISDIDTDNTGTISQAEFAQAFRDKPQLVAYLDHCGLDVKDVRLFFEVLAGTSNDTEPIAIDAFVKGCGK